MKKNIKNEKGAISLFVLLSMMFFLAFMLGAFTLVNRRNAVQIESLTETKRIYSNKASAKDQYDAIFVSSSNSLVPITNIDQLEKVKMVSDGTVQYKYLINGKIYTYEKDATYVLQNDIIIDLDDTINGKNNLQNILYDYVLYNSSYKVNLNGHSIYYRMKSDGSLWKLVFYQNIGTISNKHLFSYTDSTSTDYYGKSYSPNLFSILDNVISPYSNTWDTNENFEFLLAYNNTSEKFNIQNGIYNRWRQTNSPIKDTETVTTETETEGTETTTIEITASNVATGYTHDFTGGTAKLAGYNGTAFSYESLETYGYWGGLMISSTNGSSTPKCYLDGSVGSAKIYYPVGITTKYFPDDFDGNFSMEISSSGTNNTATECLLFVRYK